AEIVGAHLLDALGLDRVATVRGRAGVWIGVLGEVVVDERVVAGHDEPEFALHQRRAVVVPDSAQATTGRFESRSTKPSESGLPSNRTSSTLGRTRPTSVRSGETIRVPA